MKYIYLVAMLILFISCGTDETREVENGQLNSEYVSNTDTSVDESQSDRVRRAQDRLRNQQKNDSSQEKQRYKMDQEPYNKFADSDGYVDFVGASLSQIQDVLGDPPVLVRQSRDGAPVRKEVRVYFPYEEDSTGLYLYFLNEEVESFRLDTFLGLANSNIIEYFQ
ncbi:MAG: hypothetical protein LAT57_07040 [Balneolales bacterium]|nr:hypothetical protein [Balneolales bacterium]